MKIWIQFNDQRFAVNLNDGVSLARRLDFQSGYAEFGADPPRVDPLRIGDFVGDTKQGGSCNVLQLSIVPHCHGTHTESVAHIVNESISIDAINVPPWLICLLVRIVPAEAVSSDERYQPTPLAGDVMITAGQLESQLRRCAQLSGELAAAFEAAESKAVVIATEIAESGESESQQMPPYLSNDAIQWCNDNRINHLLVDVPSIDRMSDGGVLSNHHRFWNVGLGTRETNSETRKHSTVTELIDVSSTLSDGFYLLNLQVPAFAVDAAPSRPLLFPIGPSEPAK